MDREWYRTFFEGIVLEMWRAALPPEHTRRALGSRSVPLVARKG
jgi:hypothetical protein